MNKAELEEIVEELFQNAHNMGATDIHINPHGVYMRIMGSMALVKQFVPLTRHLEDFLDILIERARGQRQDHEALYEKIRKSFGQQGRTIEFSLYWKVHEDGLEKDIRVRVHSVQTVDGPSISLRVLPAKPPSFQELGVPQIWQELLMNTHEGLLLVTGQTGSGKTTTIVSSFFELDSKVIITLEDPIEYVVKPIKSVVLQMEYGVHFPDFSSAIKELMRHNPNVIYVSEIRDRETADAVLQAAETGHLVISSLHTRGAIEAVTRLLSLFPSVQVESKAAQIANVLKGVMYQVLVPSTDPQALNRMVLLTEVFIPSAAARAKLKNPEKIMQLRVMPQVLQQDLSSSAYKLISEDKTHLSYLEKILGPEERKKLQSKLKNKGEKNANR